MSNKERKFWKNYFIKERRRVARARLILTKENSEESFEMLREYWKKVAPDPVAFQRSAR